MLILHQFFKKVIRQAKVIIDLLVPFLISQKIFEKLSFTPINSFMKPEMSKYLAGFRKKYNTQHALRKMIKTLRSMLNKAIKLEQS